MLQCFRIKPVIHLYRFRKEKQRMQLSVRCFRN